MLAQFSFTPLDHDTLGLKMMGAVAVHGAGKLQSFMLDFYYSKSYHIRVPLSIFTELFLFLPFEQKISVCIVLWRR